MQRFKLCSKFSIFFPKSLKVIPRIPVAMKDGPSCTPLFHTPRKYFSNADFLSEIDNIIDIGEQKKKGKLIICPTPIGNLKDMSIRQYETLLNADIIACEDTRVTGLLFKMMKEKRIKEKFYENFEINLGEIKDITIDDFQIAEDEKFFDALGEEEMFKKRRKEKLNNLDSLSFLGKVEDEEDIGMYGLDDQFIISLKKRIKEVKEKKGRGLLLSYFKHNEEQRIPKIVKCLEFNFTVALVSDAGTPTISDPGYKLVNEAHKSNILVESLPGPTSITTGLSMSGFPSDRFIFEGYLSKTQSTKEAKLERVKKMETTAVLFESSERIMRTLLTIEKLFGEKQQIAIAFELTKLHETLIRGTVRELYEKLGEEEKLRSLRGEITLMIAPYTPQFNLDLRDNQDNSNDDGIYNINALELATILKDKLDASDKDIASLMCDILKIHKNKAMNYIANLRSNAKKEKKL